MAKKEKTNPPKKRWKKILFIIFLLVVFSVSGLFAYIYYFKDDYKPVNSEFFDIPIKTDLFFSEKSPDINISLKEADYELQKIRDEIEKIKALEKEYPEQKKITQKKFLYLKKLDASVKKEINAIITKLNDIYVQFKVNPETADKFIEQECKKIAAELKKLIDSTKEETKKFLDKKSEKPSNIIEKIKLLI